jgi:hypothetical protein
MVRHCSSLTGVKVIWAAAGATVEPVVIGAVVAVEAWSGFGA